MDNTLQPITILGSTGSIGTQTLDVIAAHPDRFRAAILTAGHNWRLLADQALQFRPQLVVIADEAGYAPLRQALEGTGIEVAQGAGAINDAAVMLPDDIVVGAMVGYSGFIPTLRALRRGKTVALANKETLVAGGQLITDTCRKHGARLLPVDSEHSAIFQCLQGESHSAIDKIILTASGGPFRTTPREQMHYITPEQALKHPNWNMGAKVTVDSATMMNKGLEMIEARWLFDVLPADIDILVHPQSIIHSMVRFVDGSVKAQLGLPDMRMPIRYALGYPERLAAPGPKLNLADYGSLTFEAPDMEKFPLLTLAYSAIAEGGTAPALMNAANEAGVRAFLDGRIGYDTLTSLPARVIDTIPVTPADSPETIAIAHEAGLACAEDIIAKL